MKREIKFRGKRIDGEGWAVGSYIEAELNNGIAHSIVPYGRFEPVVEVDPGTVGQFTGLKDKNGREVYEDDVVLQQQYGGGKGKMVVRFEKGAFIVGYHQWNMVKTKPMLLNVRCEVIGNIHDNPELLETE